MNLEQRKLVFVQEFLLVNNESTLTRLEEVLSEALANDDFKPLTLEQFESDIDKSFADSESGRIVSIEELEKHIKTWK